MDGSQKLPQRLLNPIRDRRAAGEPYPRLALAVAAWIRYASGVDEQGQPIVVSDPMAPTFERIARETGRDPAAFANAMLDQKAVFGDLAADSAFRAAVIAPVLRLFKDGARSTLAGAAPR